MGYWRATGVALAVGLGVLGTSGVSASAATGHISYQAVSFDAVPGWAEDDHAAALAAFKLACGKPPGPGAEALRQALIGLCNRAQAVKPAEARRFLEAELQPYRMVQSIAPGLLTGYYEPELEGSLSPDKRFNVPVLGRPDDLVDVIPLEQRAAASAAGKLAAMRKVGDKLEPYFTRAEIEGGALAGRGLELLYLDNYVDLYFTQVQGSARVRLPDGKALRIGYAGKNGYPYTSFGSVLIRRNLMQRDQITLASLKAWVARHPVEARSVFQENKSYVFFARRDDAPADQGPLGGQGTPLMAERSLAVDPEFHVLGLPIFVVAPTLDVGNSHGFRHLMIAQDIGSAIRGPERGDIFWGTGKAAEMIAGRVKHPGSFIVLLPRTVTTGRP